MDFKINKYFRTILVNNKSFINNNFELLQTGNIEQKNINNLLLLSNYKNYIDIIKLYKLNDIKNRNNTGISCINHLKIFDSKFRVIENKLKNIDDCILNIEDGYERNLNNNFISMKLKHDNYIKNKIKEINNLSNIKDKYQVQDAKILNLEKYLTRIYIVLFILFIIIISHITYDIIVYFH